MGQENLTIALARKRRLFKEAERVATRAITLAANIGYECEIMEKQMRRIDQIKSRP